MKKDLLTVFFIILLLCVIVGGTNIQSVDEYYLTHIDNITENSEKVYISICCDTILENYEKLDPSLHSDKFVPPDGVILPPTACVLRNGDTVFDILNRVVRHNKIQMEYQGSDKNNFNSIYIKGINYLYEFSCGPLSGWLYKINNQIPDSDYLNNILHDGDVIEWIYTCDLGHDIN